MSELGQVLQRAREEKGISLDDVQRITKIQRRYLEAIERGHFHILPGHFYARAFIKSYAEAVGLDPNHILSHFQADLPAQPPQEQMERLRRRRVQASKEPFQAGQWVTKSLFVLFVVLVIGVIYTAAVNNKGLDTSPIPRNDVVTTPEVQTPTATAPNAVPSPSTQVQVTQPNTPSVTVPPAGTPITDATSSQLTFEAQQGKVYRYTLKGADKIALKVKAVNGDCWFEVRESRTAKAVEKGMLKKGTEKMVETTKTAYIIVGSPTAVEIAVNNSPIKTADLKFFPSILDIKISQP